MSLSFKIEKTIKALNPFDLSPVNIIPTKQNKIIINPSDFNLFFDFKKFRIWPTIINVKPQIKAPAIGSVLKKLTTLEPCG